MAKVVTTLYGELALIPHQAQSPALESIEYLTDILISYNGTEQSIPLRNAPRKFVSYSIPLQAIKDPAAFNLVYSEIRNKWAIPMWAEMQLIEVVETDATVIACDTIPFSFYAPGLALIWQDPDNYQVLEITDIAVDSITIETPSREFTNAYLMPVRVGYINGSVSRPTSGYGSTFNISYNVDDLYTEIPPAPASFLANDIYFEPTLLNNELLTTEFQRLMQVIDYETGKVTYRSVWLNTRYASVYDVVTEGPVEAKVYRNFINRRQGKFRKFWMPTFENNLRLKETADTVVGTLKIHKDDYTEQRNHVAIEADGVWTAHTLSAPTYPDANSAQFTLTPSLSKPTKSINRISYLGLYRLDSDKIDMNWVGGTVMSSSVKVLELTP